MAGQHRSAFRFVPRAAVLALLVVAAPAFAQDGELDRAPTECISTASIARTKIVDDQTIIFHMRGKRAYLNYLDRKCPSLERQERFAYQSTGGRLCDNDMITVLEQWGARLAPGFSCPLGEFQPISQEEAEDLLLARERSTTDRDAIDVEAVELSPEQRDAEVAPAEDRDAEED